MFVNLHLLIFLYGDQASGGMNQDATSVFFCSCLPAVMLLLPAFTDFDGYGTGMWHACSPLSPLSVAAVVVVVVVVVSGGGSGGGGGGVCLWVGWGCRYERRERSMRQTKPNQNKQQVN